ncbi:MAG: aminodeoxychorismate/anthranilate synthase component II, partial [Nocardiopsaceae bacterium]|nr:aminodeoxychorismate/anthranilate synthase component II [Nocardiopsaceae bacterium]
MRILLIDNHDSYTYNLYQLIADVTGAAPAVLVNDDPRLARLADGGFGAAVISPGPGRPQRTRDTGHLAGFLNRTSLPVLGVCLGHQAIAHAAGADVGPAPAARHGHLSTVQPCGNQPCGNQHRGNQHWRDPLLRGLPGTFTAVRYHSLCVRDPLPPVLEAIARAEDGVIMALRHRSLPRWGVQFHPESVATQFGRELLANFLALAGRPGAREPVRLAPPPTGREPAGPEPAGTELAGPEPAGT